MKRFFGGEILSENSVFLSTSEKNNGTSHEHVCIYDDILRILLLMRKVCDKICRGNHNTHFVSNKFFSKNLVVCEINFGKDVRTIHATGDNIIRRMRIACWINRATDRHSEYAIFIALPQQNG